MLEIITDPHLRPFAIAGAVVFVLLFLEIALMMIGLSSQLGEPDVDIDAESFDTELPNGSVEALSNLEPGELIDIEPLNLDGFDTDIDVDTEADIVTAQPSGFGAFLGALGVTSVPSAIWLAGLLAFVSGLGFALQSFVSLFGFGYLNSTLALLVVFVPALYLTARYAKTIGRLIPGIETTAISADSFHRRQGKVTQGTARHLSPAEVSWVDGHGNTHYLMAPPLKEGDVISQGSDVLILRTKDKQPRIISLS